MRIQTSFRRITASLTCAGLLLPAGLQADPGGPSSPLIGYEVVGQVLNPTRSSLLSTGT